jgi:hypothetical protein
VVLCAMPLYNRLQHVQVMGPEVQAALHNPKPEIGWQGDPDLTAAYHHLTGWEILREEAAETQFGWVTHHIVIARQKAGSPAQFDINELLQGLVARDTQVREQSHKKAGDRFIDTMVKEEQARDDAAVEALIPVHEKLAWTLAKENGYKYPYISLAGLDLPPKDAVD